MPLEVAVRSLLTLQPHSDTRLHTLQDATRAPEQRASSSDAARAALASGTASVSAAAAAAAAASPAHDPAHAALSASVFQSPALALFMAYVWLMLLLTYGVAAPTGIFIPSLAIGAAGGRLAGQLLWRALRRAGVAVAVGGVHGHE
jgi:H+/Cl- antiporter ClcA